MEYRRKKLNLGVKRQFQIWLLVRILSVVIVSSLVAVLILYFYSRREISSSFYSAHIQIRRVSDLLIPVMATGALVSLLSGMALALFLPQRLAGPLYRIQKSLQAIRDGDLTEQVRLRENDALQDLATSVNEAVTGLRIRIEDIKANQREVDQLLASLEKQDAAIVVAKQRDALDRLQTQD